MIFVPCGLLAPSEESCYKLCPRWKENMSWSILSPFVVALIFPCVSFQANNNLANHNSAVLSAGLISWRWDKLWIYDFYFMQCLPVCLYFTGTISLSSWLHKHTRKATWGQKGQKRSEKQEIRFKGKIICWKQMCKNNVFILIDNIY